MKRRAVIAAAVLLGCLAGTGAYVYRTAPRADFTGQSRIRYRADVAYDYCRELEAEIGIQIFYLPEWTERENGLLHYSDLERLTLDEAYFQAVRAELEKMRDAYAHYPDGFLREVVEKKGERQAEIVLCPYSFSGYTCYGLYVHDYSDSPEKVDCVYHTGQGSSRYYSHEIGHMVMTAAAICGGWSTVCEAWDACGEGYVSDYARTSRPEDWAETWAWLWHETDTVATQCQTDAALRAKVQCMSKYLAEAYDSIVLSELPWASLL